MIDAMLFLVGLTGLVVHYTKKYLAGETTYSLLDYLFKIDAKHTAYAFLGYCVGFATIMVTHPVNDSAVFYSVFLVGFAADSVFNKASEK